MSSFFETVAETYVGDAVEEIRRFKADFLDAARYASNAAMRDAHRFEREGELGTAANCRLLAAKFRALVDDLVREDE